MSTYRLQLNAVWHVAVLGDPPPAVLDQQLRRILARGIPTSLPDDVVHILDERRQASIRDARWTERHYRDL